ncbi:CASP8 and FADD-like apoptosis regulator [Sinocyclocheilus rhinocerous]|uniref:CASP8 and FADD-like apoptosis regulator n=1 Tax=Sinocyclocheilus rhinocerous TaxID=307959 RepID=A0A673LFK8_9TELE|nr:PREDICTED: CASP8 and FADD-like apoptosis regulator [Sinocyclocheilus rhinocerous]XP_016404161.1 PREDICTED: CASP8 and FADD-like apoptosis regulator [Sinocyclocheilus rhinocerous]XP_016404162.1 PREDICTED: CASP8 and FADD-like apoptosis regulator [Sinocyclocheilus rhinocerous]XP_016404164.1 PREDICTED: CASP8 and FADD-like apoptosis regulator [Sinocyclocheilus rhinocerous]
MADGFSNMVNNVTASLKKEECKTLRYLCTDLFNNICVEDLRGALLAFAKQTQTQAGQSQAGDALLMELMFRMKRFDILKKFFGTNRQQVEGIVKKGGVLSDYRVLMADVSENLEDEELQSLIFLLSSTLPKERLARATCFLDVVVELEKLDEVSCDKLDLLEQCLRNIHRMDLVERIEAYKNRGQNVPCAVPKVQNSFKFAPVQHQSPVQPVKQSQCCSQELKNLKLSVPETGTQHQEAFMEEYEMNLEQRNLCMIIDCVGFDGDLLNRTFERLGFRVILHSLLGLKETQKVLEDLTRNRILHGVNRFVCCIISRGTDTHLLATDSSRLGIRLEDLRQLFSPTHCPSLCGKPKLFFTLIYRTSEAPNTCSMDDEYQETDAPTCHCSRRQCADARTIPVSADVLWSVCRAEAKLLEGSGHQSVYMHALSSTLLRGRERKMLLLDVMAEVNRNVVSHNQQNPGNEYHFQLSHTLRKKLYL